MMTTSPSRPGRAARLVALFTVALFTLVTLDGGCLGGPSDVPADPTSPRKNADPPRLRVTSPAPIPTGRPLASAAEFDANPCAVATAAELSVAIAEPYNLLAANTLTPATAPSTVIGSEGRTDAVGCGYSFAAPNDTSEAYHAVVVRIARWTSGGPALLAACRDAVKAKPARYRTVDLADEACLGPNAIMPVRIGAHYYTVAVTAKPGATRTPDEDVSIGAITLAATRVMVARLPR
jgi:hypothetical protein